MKSTNEQAKKIILDFLREEQAAEMPRRVSLHSSEGLIESWDPATCSAQALAELIAEAADCYAGEGEELFVRALFGEPAIFGTEKAQDQISRFLASVLTTSDIEVPPSFALIDPSDPLHVVETLSLSSFTREDTDRTVQRMLQVATDHALAQPHGHGIVRFKLKMIGGDETLSFSLDVRSTLSDAFFNIHEEEEEYASDEAAEVVDTGTIHKLLDLVARQVDHAQAIELRRMDREDARAARADDSMARLTGVFQGALPVFIQYLQARTATATRDSLVSVVERIRSSVKEEQTKALLEILTPEQVAMIYEIMETLGYTKTAPTAPNGSGKTPAPEAAAS